MRTTMLAILSFLSFALASSSLDAESSSISPSSRHQHRSHSSPSTSSTPASTSIPSQESNIDGNTWWQPIPDALQDFIAQFNNPHPEVESKHNAADSAQADSPDLRKRQKGVGGAPPEVTTTIATQMSPVTTYMVDGKPVIFTQTFAPTPDPWSGPVNGQIGLGTIQGQVGTVRTG